MFHILTYMMYLRPLVKILLPDMDLNMIYKIYRTSKYIRNRDFPKNREIRFSCYISRSSTPYALFFLLSNLLLYNFRLNQPQPPLPHASHSHHNRQPSRDL